MTPAPTTADELYLAADALRGLCEIAAQLGDAAADPEARVAIQQATVRLLEATMWLELAGALAGTPQGEIN